MNLDLLLKEAHWIGQLSKTAKEWADHLEDEVPSPTRPGETVKVKSLKGRDLALERQKWQSQKAKEESDQISTQRKSPLPEGAGDHLKGKLKEKKEMITGHPDMPEKEVSKKPTDIEYTTPPKRSPSKRVQPALNLIEKKRDSFTREENQIKKIITDHAGFHGIKSGEDHPEETKQMFQKSVGDAISRNNLGDTDRNKKLIKKYLEETTGHAHTARLSFLE
jgi:hypothetical protein